jgi:hypothetical protein
MQYGSVATNQNIMGKCCDLALVQLIQLYTCLNDTFARTTDTPTVVLSHQLHETNKFSVFFIEGSDRLHEASRGLSEALPDLFLLDDLD